MFSAFSREQESKTLKHGVRNVVPFLGLASKIRLADFVFFSKRFEDFVFTVSFEVGASDSNAILGENFLTRL